MDGFGRTAELSLTRLPGVITVGFAIAALVVETSWALLVPMVAGLVVMWGIALLHDAGYFGPERAVGRA